jgi:hypothetical protein
MTPYVRYKAPRSALHVDVTDTGQRRLCEPPGRQADAVANVPQQHPADGNVRRFRAWLFRAASSSSAG